MYSPLVDLAEEAAVPRATAKISPVAREATPSPPGRPVRAGLATQNATSRTSHCSLLEDSTVAAFTFFVRPTRPTVPTAIRTPTPKNSLPWVAPPLPRHPSPGL